MEQAKNEIKKAVVKKDRLNVVYNERFSEANYTNVINKSCDQIIHLSDLPGGSPFKTAVECMYARPEQKIEVIAGTNLPMIVTAVTMLDMEDDPRSLADELIETGRDCIALFELEAATAETESEESDGI